MNKPSELYLKEIRVTCAIILFGDRVFVVQRSENMKMPLKWEFPGGKIEPNETEEACIKREIKEEINIEIEIIKKLSQSQFDYPDISIHLIPFLANYKAGEVILKEHKQYQILKKNDLSILDWADADIPILKEFLNR